MYRFIAAGCVLAVYGQADTSIDGYWWVLGSPVDSCETTCSSLGRTCDESGFGNITADFFQTASIQYAFHHGSMDQCSDTEMNGNPANPSVVQVDENPPSCFWGVGGGSHCSFTSTDWNVRRVCPCDQGNCGQAGDQCCFRDTCDDGLECKTIPDGSTPSKTKLCLAPTAGTCEANVQQYCSDFDCWLWSCCQPSSDGPQITKRCNAGYVGEVTNCGQSSHSYCYDGHDACDSLSCSCTCSPPKPKKVTFGSLDRNGEAIEDNVSVAAAIPRLKR